jgi:hypothetical protein
MGSLDKNYFHTVSLKRINLLENKFENNTSEKHTA